MEKHQLIEKAHNIESTRDLFNLLNEIKNSLLGCYSYPFGWNRFLNLSNPDNDKKRYYSFVIPKKSGELRQICAPLYNLKWIQLCLNEIFKALYTPSPYAMGFASHRSIVDNARMHTNQNYVFNIDLQDFFHSIDKARVCQRLQLAPFNVNPTIANVIAGLCSIKIYKKYDEQYFRECFVLPQGAPTSPLLSNAVCDILDKRLHGLAKRFGLHYSRYADDITFSSMHNVYQENSEFRKELERIITNQKFTINPNKVRLSHCSKRQEVTGLTVGIKVNVSRKFVKNIRAILHIWGKYGYDAAYAAFYPKYFSEGYRAYRQTVNLVNMMSGKLCFLKMVKGENDPVYVKLNEQFIRVSKQQLPNFTRSNIDYLMTMKKSDFEKKMGVTIYFNRSRYDSRIYGYFDFNDKRFVVAVSKKLDVDNLPENVQISLCRTISHIYFRYPEFEHNEYTPKSTTIYMLHKPHYGLKNINKPIEIPDDIKEMVINFVNKYPALELKDEFGIIDEYSKKST